MGQENHTVLSPAHRRNQNPLSPSGSVFRKSTTFSREEADLSWMALIRRHRFLLSMLALLMFLCTIYLYFAIKLGSDDCSGLIGNEETLCRLKRSNAKISHGHKSSRRLLDVQESAVELFSRTRNLTLDPKILYKLDSCHLMDFLSREEKIKSILVLGCIGDNLMVYLKDRYEVSKFDYECRVLTEGSSVNFPLDYRKMGLSSPHQQFDLIVYQKCSQCQLHIPDDGRKNWKLKYLLRKEGILVSISGELSKVGCDESLLQYAAV